MAAMATAKAEGKTRMRALKIYSLADLEDALRKCNHAVIQTRRGQGGPILILDELKNDAEALTRLVARARAEPSNSLSSHDIEDLLPRLAYWHQQDRQPPSSRSEIVKAHEGMS
jgi:hypothetical protein